MDSPTSLIVIVIVGAAMAALGLIRTGRQLRRMSPGREREALAASLWSMGGSTAIILAIAMGLPPLSLPLWPRILVLGGAVSLVVTGGVKSKHLRKAREQELLQAGANAVNLADRIEVLEGQRLKYRRMPFHLQFTMMGGKAVAAGSALWALKLIGHGALAAVFGTFALAATGWLAWDVVNLFRRRASRERIDAEIEGLLDAVPAIPEGQHRGAWHPDADDLGGHP